MSYPDLYDEEVRNAKPVEGEHLWISWTPKALPGQPMISCRWCGILKSVRGNKPCRGPVRIKLR